MRRKKLKYYNTRLRKIEAIYHIQYISNIFHHKEMEDKREMKKKLGINIETKIVCNAWYFK